MIINLLNSKNVNYMNQNNTKYISNAKQLPNEYENENVIGKILEIDDSLMLNSDRYSERNKKIDAIILHHTVCDFEICMELFQGKRFLPSGKVIDVSTHYIINYLPDENKAKIYHLVPDDKAAWHAGISCFRGEKSVNHNSIGIEIVNNGASKFEDAQMEELLKLLKFLKDKYNIKAENIIGHADVAYWRKSDPSALFDWERLAQNGFGIFHDIKFEDNPLKFTEKNEILNFQILLHKLGYEIEPTGEYDIKTKALIAIFRDHYHINSPSQVSYKDENSPPDHHNEDYCIWDNNCQKVAENLLSKINNNISLNV